VIFVEADKLAASGDGLDEPATNAIQNGVLPNAGRKSGCKNEGENEEHG